MDDNFEKTNKKIARKKNLWDKIKANEEEYNRLQEKIDVLKQEQSDIIFKCKKSLDEIEKIGEYLSEIEYKYLCNDNK